MELVVNKSEWAEKIEDKDEDEKKEVVEEEAEEDESERFKMLENDLEIEWALQHEWIFLSRFLPHAALCNLRWGRKTDS